MVNKRTVVVALLVATFAFLFKDVVVKLVSDWGSDDNYSHGFLVVPVAGYIAWSRRARLASLPVHAAPMGLAIVVGGLVMLVVGMIGAELFLTRLALLGTLGGTIMFVWGREHLKELRFPFLLLALAIPIPAIIFNQITFPLQLLASRFGEYTIAACQIPVLREGNVITLATTSLEVVEACSGIRSLVSLMAMALIWGYVTESPTWLRWLLALSSVPIAIFANGIRVAGTGVAAHFIGPAAAEGFLHTFSGWLVFVVAGILLLGAYRLAGWFGRRVRTKSQVPGPPEALVESAPPQPRQRAQIVPRSLTVITCLLVVAAALGTLTRTEAFILRQPLRTLPLSVGPWQGRDSQAFDAKLVAALGVDDYINRSYVAPGGPWVSLYVGYYKSQRQGQTIHSPLNCMPGGGWEAIARSRVTIPATTHRGLESEGIVINRLVVQKGLDRQLVFYWYQAHGRIVASEYWGKIYTVVDAIRMNRSDGALVRVVIPLSSREADSEYTAERAALEFVNRILPVLATRLDE